MSFVALYEEKERFKQQANITAILAAASLEIKKSCACFSEWNWEQWTLYIFLAIFSFLLCWCFFFCLFFYTKEKLKLVVILGRSKK